MTTSERKRRLIEVTIGGKKSLKEKFIMTLKWIAIFIIALGILALLCAVFNWALNAIFPLPSTKTEKVSSGSSGIVTTHNNEPEFLEAQKKFDEEKIKSNVIGVKSEDQTAISEYEMNLLIRAVQHEVGSNPSYYAGYDFNSIQCQMACVIWNRVNDPNYPNTVYGVLTQPGQFMDLSELEEIEPNEETRENVSKVISGKFESPALFEMSFNTSSGDEAQQIMEEQVGSIYPVASSYTTDGRYLLFAAPN